jgi:predicted RNA-binding Zn-ribbon protein involved in translation (DUF1610 family)
MLLSKEIMRKPKDSYVCPRCGYVLPKEDAIVSGWDSERSLRHVNCPKCGKIITHTP